VLETLEALPLEREPNNEPLRLPVQWVLRPHLNYRGFAGQLASGELQVGDEVQVLPSGSRTRVRAIDTFEGEIPRAFAPMSVTVRLADEVDVSRGDVIVRPDAPTRMERRFEATVVWLHERPLDPARSYFLQHTSRVVPARLEQVRWRMDLETLEPTPVERLELNDIGQVVVQCSRPLLFDSYERNRSMGAFIVIDALTNNTVGAGVIKASPSSNGLETSRTEAEGLSRVTPEERRLRLGQAGALLYLEGDTARAQAVALERALFERGYVATVVDSGEAATACATAGILTLVAASGESTARERLRAMLRVSGLPLVEWLSGETGVETALAALAEQGVISLSPPIKLPG